MGQRMKKNGAALFAECLVAQGVEVIFGIPGAKIDALFNALIDTPIKIIPCRHEQNATFMAGAMGRLTGKPGVVLVTSGPGVSNLITGLLTATTEGDPIVAIGGNVSRSMKLKESHQGTDNVRITEAATKESVEVSLAENIPEIVENAFRLAKEPRSGAVFISIPQDVLLEDAGGQKPLVSPELRQGPAAKASIDQTIELFSKAKRPALLLGLEASREENSAAIRALLTKTRIATVGTYQAAGVIPRELLDCFVGRVGLFKNQPGDRLLDEADLVITIGYSPVEYDPEVWNTRGDKKIVHIDYMPANLHATYVPTVENIGRISKTLEALSKLLEPREKLLDASSIQSMQEDLEEKIAQGKKFQGAPIHPLRFIHDLHQVTDDETTIISDIGTHYMWLARYFLSHNPRRLLFSNGQQTLGVALPWAMATRLVRPKDKIISISGDGGFLFSGAELETAVREGLHFVHCIWCDGSYDMVKEQQLMKYNRDCAVAFGPVDHVKFAESFGATGYRVNASEELLPILKKALATEGPVLIEVPIDYSHNRELFEMSSDTYH